MIRRLWRWLVSTKAKHDQYMRMLRQADYERERSRRWDN